MDVAAVFLDLVNKNTEHSIAVSAITALTELIKQSKATTMMELNDELTKAVQKLKGVSLENSPHFSKRSSISLASGCELFLRFVTRAFLEISDFDECKSILIGRGEYFAKLSIQSRKKVAQLFEPFFRDRMVILIHGFSRVVMATLLHAAETLNKRFTVISTESRPDQEGYKAAKVLQNAGIPVTLILDSAVANMMSKVDFVLVGAEGVVESGGIINKIGTYQIAIVAQAHKKPFYVAAESFKFTRQYPLSQTDLELLPEQESYSLIPSSSSSSDKNKGNNNNNNNKVYTRKTLLFFDDDEHQPASNEMYVCMYVELV
eukprot:GEZU01020568.1.p1 GENE.GEZU01020568.1~~GEZU01020568.1.p1  ORF type:complete len:339 (+),score=82.67 GEZU01020568.1:66-1019(+)